MLVLAGGAGAGAEPAAKIEATGPVIPVKDLVFIMDSSQSVDAQKWQTQTEIVTEFLCGPLAPDPTVEPFGLAVIMFSDDVNVLIPYLVIDSAAELQAICDSFSPLQVGTATHLSLALEEAVRIFETDALAPVRTLHVMSDGGMVSQTNVVLEATTLRTMTPPVRICVADVSTNCDHPVLERIANSVFSPQFDPLQPIGLYGCTRGFEFSALFCDDCTCDTDCNGNGILDTIDVLSGGSFDLNGDFLPDECMDCNFNGLFDAQEVIQGLASDCNENGILDACDIDNLTSIDCNGNLVPDSCEDCNGDGVADECEVTGIHFGASDILSPIGLGSPVEHTFAASPLALGDVTVEVAAVADVGGSFKTLDVFLNGDLQGTVFTVAGTQSCPIVAERDQVVIPVADFNALVAGGDAVFTIQTFDGVNALACDGNPWVALSMRYLTTPVVLDVNANSVPDDCDLARGDSDLDGIVGILDFLAVLSQWGACPPMQSCPEDADLDSIVGILDFLNVLSNWG